MEWMVSSTVYHLSLTDLTICSVFLKLLNGAKVFHDECGKFPVLYSIAHMFSHKTRKSHSIVIRTYHMVG